MHGGGNQIYELHVIIHNGVFAECEVLDNFEDFVVHEQGQGLVNWSSKMLKDKDFPRGQQHWQTAFLPITIIKCFVDFIFIFI